MLEIIALVPRGEILSSTTKTMADEYRLHNAIAFNYNSKLDCEDYSKNEQEFIAYLAFL